MKKRDSVSAMEWFAWVWIGLLLLLAISTNAIFQGISLHSANLAMVYENPMNYAILISVIALIWTTAHAYRKKFQLERRMIYAILASLFCIVYLMSSLNGESSYLSRYGVFVSLAVFIFFAAGTFLIQYDRLIQCFPKIYLLFGYCIVAYGLLNLMGNAYLLDSLSFNEGVRISSIFQYANAYAVLLLTLWVTILIELNRTTKLWIRLLHGFMLIPVCVSFLLTLSRGAIIALPIIAIVILMMFKLKQQIRIILYSVIALGLSLSIYSHLEEVGTEVYNNIQQARAQEVPFDKVSIFSSQSIVAWGMLAGVSILMAVALYLITKYVEPRILKKIDNIKSAWGHRIVPIGFITLLALAVIALTNESIMKLLPDVMGSRIGDISFKTHSVYERLTMYEDAIQIWRESPIIGGGAGVWDALYEQHQSYAYVSAQTHGYFAQLLIEIGIVGIAVYLGLIMAVIIAFVSYYRKASELDRDRIIFFFIVPVTILIHSSIDFEMSYMFYLILVFLCLGVLAGTQRQPDKRTLTLKTMGKIKWGVFIIAAILILVITIPTSRQLYAVGKYKESEVQIANNIVFDAIEQTLKAGLSNSSKHPGLLFQLSLLNYQVYEQTKDTKYLESSNIYMTKLKKHEPNYRQSVELEYLIAVNLGKRDEANAILIDSVKRYPFEQSLYELAATELVNHWDIIRTFGAAESRVVAEKITDLYGKMQSREQVMLDLPKYVLPLKTIEVTNAVRLAVAKVLYSEREYTKVDEVLSKGITDDLSTDLNRQVIRYYLAALQQQGKNDEILYQKLTQGNIAEQQELQKLLASN